MIANDVAQLLGNLIAAEVGKLPVLAAVAIFFETGQGAPVFYLAHEAPEHSITRLHEYADEQIAEMQKEHDDLIANGPQMRIDKFASDLSAVPHLHQKLIGDHCNGLLETGYWVNPSAPVLSGVDPAIDAWATSAFAALSASGEEFYVAYDALTGTFGPRSTTLAKSRRAGRRLHSS
jgi:hypothetical protein